MFKFARKHSRSFWVKVMYSLIAFSFLIGFAVFIGSGITSYVRTGGLAPNIVAEVNGKQITLIEFERTLRNLKQEIDNPYIKELFLMQLVNRILLTEIAKSYGFSVPDSELAEHIASLKYFADSNGKFNEKIYYAVLKQNNLTPEAFETGLREELLINNFRNFLKSLISPADEDLWWYFRKKNEKSTFYVAKIEPEKFQNKIEISEGEIKKYYETYRDEFKGNPKKSFEYLVFPYSEYENRVSVSERDIESYYKKNRKKFITGSEKRLKSLSEVRNEIEKKLKSEKAKELAKNEAEEARKMLTGGEGMSEVAQKFGLSKKSAGPADEDEIKNVNGAGKILSELFNSLDEGKISEIKETEDALLIVRITNVIPPSPLTQDEARPKIKNKLQRERAKDYARSEAEKLQKEIKVQANPLKYLEKKGYKVEITDEVGIDSTFIKGVGFAPGFFTQAEGLTDRKRFPEKPYEFLGNYYVFWLKEKKTADRSFFESNKDKIRDEYIEEEVNKKLQELIQNARKTAKIKINKEIFAGEKKGGTPGKIPPEDLF